jgi:beta-aspartyl-peptidase (threonine type)
MPLNLRSQSFAMPGPALLAHGGAWEIPDNACDDHRDGLESALRTGRELLVNDVAALDVVTETVATLEAHGAFDAGRGAMLNQDGEAELDAGVMEGHTLAYGAVLAVQRIAHPVRVARQLLAAGEGQVRMLAGEGAERFAEAQGFELIEKEDLICDRERDRFAALRKQAEHFYPSQSFRPGAMPSLRGHDTVGCVARDADGQLAAATSTGGTPFKPPGRVGDSPLPGAGFYATEGAAVSATGWGEAIAAVVLASRTVEAIRQGKEAEAAVRTRLADMHAQIQDRGGQGATGGLITLDARGNGAMAFTTPRMARGGWHANAEPWVAV